jgi:DNA-binding NtrC family response regulator
MIIVVEDDPVIRRSVVEFLETAGHDVEGFSNAEDALAAARESPPDVLVTDIQLPGMSGLDLIAELGKVDPGIVRIAMTAHASVQSVITAMRHGAYEYLEKPVDLEQLVRLVERAVAQRRSSRELDWLRSATGEPEGLETIVGDSPAIAAVRRQVEALAQLGEMVPPVLITGETGVGKGVLARTIHVARLGADASWIEINCAALPATLIEAELFGYERSAFTDAKQAKPGLFEAAGTGTVFLDEIGELDLPMQAKLLKVVESQSVRRLGSVRDRPIRAAIIAASNMDLKSATQDGSFRADLFHRLAAFAIEIPPLRERGDDALALAQILLADAAGKYRKALTGLAPEAEAAIRGHTWPGNVRELRFAIERAVILSPRDATLLAGALVQTEHSDGVGGPQSASTPAGGAGVRVDASGVHVDLPEEGVPFAELERAILNAALGRSGGNVVGAARLLDLSRDAVRYRMRKLGLGTKGGQ